MNKQVQWQKKLRQVFVWNEENRSVLEDALAYAQLGWHIIPLEPAGASGDSGCAISEYHERDMRPVFPLGLATTDPETIRRWWEVRPYAYIGIGTGRVSRLVVYEVDHRRAQTDEEQDAFYQALDDIEAELAFVGLFATSHSGASLRFVPSDLVPGSTRQLAPGVWRVGNMGYIAAPLRWEP